MSTLLPLSSAPLDGTDILLWLGSGYVVGFHDDGDWYPSGVDTTYDMASVVIDGTPIGWLPLFTPDNV